MIMSILNASTGNAIGSAVVGKDGEFSTTIRVGNKDTKIKVVPEHNNDYIPQTTVIEAK